MSPLIINDHTEKELIELCLKGDHSACKSLFDLYSGKMMALCYRFARDNNEAKDMLQEGFVRIFTKMHLYSGKGSFEAWMKRVMINTALKYRQRYVVRHNYADVSDIHVFDDNPGALDDISGRELIQLVQELPDGYRTVFNLYVIEGYSHKEIAAMLNIGESTSRSQLVKARNMLQGKLMTIKRLAG